ncbi:hypothetical protein KIPB_012448, partial [Kipferlia bialata]|eukprot:g12448.t1
MSDTTTETGTGLSLLHREKGRERERERDTERALDNVMRGLPWEEGEGELRGGVSAGISTSAGTVDKGQGEREGGSGSVLDNASSGQNSVAAPASLGPLPLMREGPRPKKYFIPPPHYQGFPL